MHRRFNLVLRLVLLAVILTGIFGQPQFHVFAAATNISTITIPSTPAGGVGVGYAAGEVVTIRVTFTAAETVTGTPSIVINVGGNLRKAIYVSGSGTTNLDFAYTVVAGDADANGISIPANSLALNGASINNGIDAAQITHNAVADQGADMIAATVAALDTTAPVLRAAVGAGSTITLSYDELGSGLRATPVPATSVFTFSRNGGVGPQLTVSSVSINHTANTVTLGLNGLISLADTNMRVSYTANGTNDVQDVAGNKVANFSNVFVANTMPSFDVKGNTLSFDNPSSITGDGRTAGNKVLFSNIITVDGQSIDAIVTTTALNGATLTGFDTLSGTTAPILTTTPAAVDALWFKLNTTIGATGGDATITFNFIKSGSYNAANLTATKGDDVILQNVAINSYDLDGAGGDVDNYQYQEFGGFATYTVANNSALTQTQVGALTHFQTTTGGNVTSSPGTDAGDQIRVMALYEAIHQFQLKTGSIATGGIAYYYLDFSKGPNWFNSTLTYEIPTVNPKVTNDTTPDISGTFVGAAFTNGAASATVQAYTLRVTVNGKTYTAGEVAGERTTLGNGDIQLLDATTGLRGVFNPTTGLGTWTLTIPPADALPLATYDVSVDVGYGTSLAAINKHTLDDTTNELVINGTPPDTTAPTFTSITRGNPVEESITPAALAVQNYVDFTVTFSEEVTNVDLTDFQITGAGSTGSNISSVTQTGPTTYTVRVSNIPTTNGGILDLNLLATTDVVDLAGNLLTATIDPVEGVNPTSGIDETYFITRSDLDLDKQVSDATPYIGSEVTFSLVVSNTGNVAATNVVVTDVIPTGYTYVASSIAGADSRSDTSPTGTGLTWTINSLATGASTTLTYRATVLASGTYNNYAEITSHTEGDLDSTPGNASTTEDDDDTVTVTPAVPQMNVQKTSSGAGTVNAGGTITYTINIENDSALAMTNIAVNDAVPAGTTFVSGTVNGHRLLYDYRDDFASASYNLSTGTQNWSANAWTETGDNNLPGTGSISITGGELYFNDPAGDSIERTIGNLSGKSAVFLDIDVRETGGWDLNDTYTVDIWDGSAWHTVSSRSGEFTDPAADTLIDISDHANANTRIRIDTTNVGDNSQDENLYVAYVRVYYAEPFSGALPHAAPGIIQSADQYMLAASDGVPGSGPDFMTITYQVQVDSAPVGSQVVNSVDVTSTQVVDPISDSTTDTVVAATAVLSDFIWNDLNGNGVQDGGLEVGLANVRVYVDQDGDNTYDAGEPTATTNVSGNYSLGGLAAGTYDVRVDTTTLPVGFNPTFDLDGGNDHETSVTVIAGQTRTDVDFGYQQQNVVISNFVWTDLNGNGVQDGGLETGLDGVRVYVDQDGDNAYDAGEPTAVTAGGGLYSITGLAAGTYNVRVDTTTLPAGYNPSFDLDGANDNEASVSLTAGQIRDDIDFGYQQQNAVISDFIWNDLDGDGVQDGGGEVGLPNIRVYVDVDGDNSYDAGEPSDLTDGAGLYTIAGLAAGTYAVRVDITTLSAGFNPTSDLDGGSDNEAAVALTPGQIRADIDFGYQQQNAVISDFLWSDLDGDGIQDAGENGIDGVRVYVDNNNNNSYDLGEVTATTAAGGFYTIGNLPAGTYNVRVDTSTLPAGTFLPTFDLDGGLDDEASVTLTPGQVRDDVDFGYQSQNAIISDYVWDDANGDGAQAAETGLQNVRVYIDVDGDDSYVAGEPSDLTDASGLYSIGGLTAGTYDVRIDTTTLPAGYNPTFDLDGGNNNEASVTVATGQVRDDIDFGYQQQNAVISDYVWDDANGDGAQTGENGLPNVRVYIDFDGDNTYDAGEPSDLTDGSGLYSISGLAAGTYDVRIDTTTLPVGYNPTFDLDGGNNNESSVTLTPGQVRDDVDFGYQQQNAVISDYVWDDINGDGAQTGEAGLQNVRVYIDLNTDNTYDPGEPNAVTDLSGNYSITGLAAGTHNVRIDTTTLPANYAPTFDVDGGNDHEASVTLLAGQTRDDVDFGYQQQGTVSGHLYYDENGNGTQDGAEPDLANVDVLITPVSGAPFTVTTDGGGNWSALVTPGSTTAAVDIADTDFTNAVPAGWSQTEGTDPTTVTAVSGTDTVTDNDGYYTAATVSGHLYIDSNGNGTQDGGEPDLANVDVVITTSTGGTITVTTDGNGNWTATVPPGNTTANVDETDPQYPTGYNQTEGTDPNNTTAVAGVDTDAGTDGYYSPATIGDTVFLDDGTGGGISANGVQDGSEAGISGITVYVDIDASGTFTAGDLSDTTDGSGNYSITNIPPGTYNVRIDPTTVPAGYTLTTGNDPTNITLTLGETDNTIDFGFIGPRADLSLDKSVSDTTPLVATNITFTLDVTNSGPDAATNVEVTDVLPSGFAHVSDDSAGAYDPNTGVWTVGNLAVNQTASLTMTVTVNLSGSYTNYAEITASDVVDPDSTPNDSSNNQDDDDSVTVTPTQNDADGLSKNLSGSNQAFTLNDDVAIGEIVEYTVSVTIPSGTFNNARLVDTMERGLSFMDCTSITDNGLTTSTAGGFTSICSTPTVDDAGGGTPTDTDRRVTFDFGTLTNGTGSDQQLVIVYRAVVLDSTGNVSGTDLANNATWTSDAGSLTPESESVTVVEPDVSILKTANVSTVSIGSVVTFTLTIRHTSDSETDAYDTLVTDTLPSALQYVAGSIDCTTGAQDADVTCTESGGTITAEWSNFTLGGGDGRVTFQATVTALPAAGISNVANVAWSSLPGTVNTPQNSNQFSTERDYDPPSQVDVYGVSSTLILNNPNPGGSSNGSSRGLGSSLPDTGFAPNVVTDMSHVPHETYAATGDVTVEIPSLGVKIPVVGIPKKNGTWNVSWLANQAGWLEGSAFPSWNGNSVLTGHVYLSNGLPGPFVNLSKLKFGDRIVIHAYGQKYTFEVQENKVVQPDDTSALKHEEKPWLTLITCKEYDAKTNTYKQRVVVRAVLVRVDWE